MKSVRLTMVVLGVLFATETFAQEQKIDRHGELRTKTEEESTLKSRPPVRKLHKREVKIHRELFKVDSKKAEPASEH